MNILEEVKIYFQKFRRFKMQNKFLTIKQFCNLYPAFTNGTLRMLIFNADYNGFNSVIKRISPTGKRGRILIDIEKFFEWLENQNKQGGNAYA